MYKFVVLCAFAAAAVAKPEPAVLLDASLGSPLTYPSIVSPGVTTISSYGSSILPYYGLNAPLAYSHLIKKRSPQLIGSYISPTPYISADPWATTAYTAPVLSTSPFYGSALAYGTPAHLIKKRQVAALPLATSYIAPTTYAATAPLLTTSYAAGAQILPASPVIAASPLGIPHLIKKRQAPLIASSYIAPTSLSTGFDFRASLYPSYASSLPYSYYNPLAYSYLLKK